MMRLPPFTYLAPRTVGDAGSRAEGRRQAYKGLLWGGQLLWRDPARLANENRHG